MTFTFYLFVYWCNNSGVFFFPFQSPYVTRQFYCRAKESTLYPMSAFWDRKDLFCVRNIARRINILRQENWEEIKARKSLKIGSKGSQQSPPWRKRENWYLGVLQTCRNCAILKDVAMWKFPMKICARERFIQYLVSLQNHKWCHASFKLEVSQEN